MAPSFHPLLAHLCTHIRTTGRSLPRFHGEGDRPAARAPRAPPPLILQQPAPTAIRIGVRGGGQRRLPEELLLRGRRSHRRSIVQMAAYHVRSVSLPCRSHPLLAHLCTHIAARGAQDCRKADTNPWWSCTSLTPASTSARRRSSCEEMPRCYVVYVGRVPCVYEEWKDCQKQVNNFSGNSYQGYESREVAEEKWRRHGRKKWRNFLVITTLLLFIVGCVLLHLGRATSLEL